MTPREKKPLFTTTFRLLALLAAFAAAGRPAFADGGAAATSVATSSGPAAASLPAKSGGAWGHLVNIWSEGGYELYLPVYTFHMPYAYTRSLLRSYNDFPVGGGIGKGRFNESGNWEGVFAMEFADSHGRPEYEGGYAWIATWHPFDNGFRAGAGYTAFITARSDIRRYTPFPGVLPLGSIGYRNLDLQCTFVPGGRNDGNVLFTWVKFAFY